MEYMESVVPFVTEERDTKCIENLRSMYVEYIKMLDVYENGNLVRVIEYLEWYYT